MTRQSLLLQLLPVSPAPGCSPRPSPRCRPRRPSVWPLRRSVGPPPAREDICGQPAGPPSEKLVIKAAFLQNTLQQMVLAGGFYFVLAAVAGGCGFALFASLRNAVRGRPDLFLPRVQPGCAEAVSGHAAERTGVSGCRVSGSFRRVRTRSFFGRLQYPILYKGNSTVRDFLVCYRRATRHRPDIRYRQGLRESRPKFCFGASWRTYREWLSGPQWMLHARPATHSIGLPRSSFFRYS